MANDFTFDGFPDECHKFEHRHPVWNEIMGNPVKAMNRVFIEMRRAYSREIVHEPEAPVMRISSH